MLSVVSRYHVTNRYVDENSKSFVGIRPYEYTPSTFNFRVQGFGDGDVNVGQTFESISFDWFGNSIQWWAIADQNRLMFPEGEMEVGDIIAIPAKTVAVSRG